ncbi:tetratricopeptide repeat protein [Methylosinus sporium]|uniref:tetratricopeptide repeat protein n=1 Tax=Methylosinus sporium TaxID=428 RepID=UPI00383A90C4
MRLHFRLCLHSSVTVGLLLHCVFVARAELGTVKAETGGVAIGGNVDHSCIGDCSGIRPEQLQEIIQQSNELSETQKKVITNYERELDLNRAQIRVFFDILGDANVPPERWAEKLVEFARRLKSLEGQIAATYTGDDKKLTALKADAQKAIKAANLATADKLLAQIETLQRVPLDRLDGARAQMAANMAATKAQRGEIALAELQFGEAAKHFAAAAAVFAPGDANENRRLSYLDREADAYYRQGNEFGDNGALISAVDLLQRILIFRPRARVPLEWAMTQNILGTALSTLGEREGGREKLSEAIAAYREALKEYTCERAPLERAMTQTNLGAALERLGERENGPERLEEAILVLRDALGECTRKRFMPLWAATQNNLGNALVRLGEREKGSERLEEAVLAFREVLKEYTQERFPLQWAAAQNNLGNALARLGEREKGPERLEEAIAAFREALKERPYKRFPLLWAATQFNLGNALERLGERQSDATRLGEAISAFREVLKEYTDERFPLEWAMTENGLSSALTKLAELNKIGRAGQAISAYRAKLEEVIRRPSPIQQAISLGNLGVATMQRADLKKDIDMAKNAYNYINAAYNTIKVSQDDKMTNFYKNRLLEAQALLDRLGGH